MKVHFRAYARFRELFGDRTIIGITPETTIATLLQHHIAVSEEQYSALFEPDGSIKKHIILMRNGKRVIYGAARDEPLTDGDEVGIIPPVAGG